MKWTNNLSRKMKEIGIEFKTECNSDGDFCDFSICCFLCEKYEECIDPCRFNGVSCIDDQILEKIIPYILEDKMPVYDIYDNRGKKTVEQEILNLIMEQYWEIEWEWDGRENINAWIEGIDSKEKDYLIKELFRTIGYEVLKYTLGDKMSDNDAEKMSLDCYDAIRIAEGLLP